MITPDGQYRYNPPPRWPVPPSGWVAPNAYDFRPDPSWGPPPAGWVLWIPTGPTAIKRPVAMGWVRGHKVLAGFGVFLLLAAVGSVIRAVEPVSLNEPANVSVVDPSTVQVDQAALDGQKLNSWIEDTGHFTNEVQVAVQSMQMALKVLQDGGDVTAISDIASFSGLVKQSQEFCDDAASGLVVHIDAPLKTERNEAFVAAEGLSDAMKKLRSYLDDSKPSTLSDFQTMYAEATTSWNDAVKKIWSRAGATKPPVV